MTTSIITNNSKYFLSDWIALDYTVPGSIVLGTGNVGSLTKSNSGSVELTGTTSSGTINGVTPFTGLISVTSLGTLNPEISQTASTNTIQVGIGSVLVTNEIFTQSSTGYVGSLSYHISKSISSVVGNGFVDSVDVPIEQFIFGNQANLDVSSVKQDLSQTISSITTTIEVGVGSVSVTNTISSNLSTSHVGSLSYHISETISNDTTIGFVDSVDVLIEKSIVGNQANLNVSNVKSELSNTLIGNISSIVDSNPLQYNTSIVLSGQEIQSSLNPVQYNTSIVLSGQEIQSSLNPVQYNANITFTNSLPSSVGVINSIRSNFTEIQLLGNQSKIELSDIQLNYIKSIKSNRLLAQSGLIVQERSNGLYGNTGTISYGNEQTDHRELLTPTTGYLSVNNVPHITSVNTPGVEEIVYGTLGQCGSNVSVSLSGTSSTVTIGLLSYSANSRLHKVESSIIAGTVITNISNLLIILNGIQNPVLINKVDSNLTVGLIGNDSNITLQQINSTVIKPITSVLSLAQSGILNQFRSNGIVGNTGTISYGNEPSVVSKNLSTVSIGGNVDKVLCTSSHNIPGIEENIICTTGNVRSNVTLSISGTSSNFVLGTVSSHTELLVNRTECIATTGTILPHTHISNVLSGIQLNAIVGSVLFQKVVTDVTVSLSGNKSNANVNSVKGITSIQVTNTHSTVSINNIKILTTKSIAGIVSHLYGGKVKVLQGSIRMVSVGLVRFARTSTQDIEFAEIINRNVRYR